MSVAAKPEGTGIHAWVTKEMASHLRAQAQREDRTMSSLVKHALAVYLRDRNGAGHGD